MTIPGAVEPFNSLTVIREVASPDDGAPSLDADVVTTANGWRLRDRRGRWWALPDLPGPVAAAVTRLDGGHQLDGLLGTLTAAERHLFEDLLDEFTQSQLTVAQPGPPTSNNRGPTVAVIGCGTLGSAIADQLVELPIQLHLIDPLPPDPVIHGSTSASTAAEAIRQRLLLTGAHHQLWWPTHPVGSHWAELTAQSAVDLVVVTSSQVEVDRAISSHLTRAGIAHLVASAHRHQATVGPWVVPGANACLGCLDHHRNDHDAAWATIAARLSSRRAQVSSSLAIWVATTVGCWLEEGLLAPAMVSASTTDDRLNPSGPTSTSAVVSLRGENGLPQTQWWPPHHACACRSSFGLAGQAGGVVGRPVKVPEATG